MLASRLTFAASASTSGRPAVGGGAAPALAGATRQEGRRRQSTAAALQHFPSSRPATRSAHAHHTTHRCRRIAVGAGPAGGGVGSKKKSTGGAEVDTPGRALVTGVALAYMALILFLPALNVFYQAFRNGAAPFFENLVDPDFLHAIKMTALMAGIAVPLNTAWGVAAALLIARNEFRGKAALLSVLDLPFSVSPVVAGMMLVLLYGRTGLFAPLLTAAGGVKVLYAAPGMVLATLFVTLPYVCRELVPILEASDIGEEEAAATLGASPWGVFTQVTLPNIKWGLLYGMVLTNARAVGEFGAVAVVSGNIVGRTQTLTLFVESAYKEYNTAGAFAAAVLLSLLAFATLYVKDRLERDHGDEI